MTLYGLGIGWRPEVSGIIAQLDGLAFCEVIAESVGNEIPPHLGSLGVPVIPHGISLSLGGAEAVDQARIDHLARASQLLGAPLASEHIAFVRAGGIEAGHLLPLPRTLRSRRRPGTQHHPDSGRSTGAVRRRKRCRPVRLAGRRVDRRGVSRGDRRGAPEPCWFSTSRTSMPMPSTEGVIPGPS